MTFSVLAHQQALVGAVQVPHLARQTCIAKPVVPLARRFTERPPGGCEHGQKGLAMNRESARVRKHDEERSAGGAGWKRRSQN
jgi:hypothetical protein